MIGSYFTSEHYSKDSVSNAKQLTAPKPKEPEPHPLQREFIDVLKSLSVYEDFQESVFVLPVSVDISTYCAIFPPENWLDSNARGYSEWLSYLKQYHHDYVELSAVDRQLWNLCHPLKQEKSTPETAKSVCPKHHEALEKGKELSSPFERTPKKPNDHPPEITQQEKFKQFLRDKGALEKFEYWLMNAQFSMLETHSNLAQAWTNLFGEDLEEWVNHAFDWSKSGSHVFWAEINADWLAICKDENIN